MRYSHFPILGALLVGAAPLAAQTASLSGDATARLSATGSRLPAVGIGESQLTPRTQTSGPLIDSDGYTNSWFFDEGFRGGIAGAQVEVRYGSIKARAHTLSQLGINDPYRGLIDMRSEAKAYGAVRDYGTFSLAGYNAGTLVNLTAWVSVTGSVGSSYSPGSGSQSRVEWNASLGQAMTNGGGVSWTAMDYIQDEPLATGYFYLSATIALGALTEIQYGALTTSLSSSSARCSNLCDDFSTTAEGAANFANTFLWGGISDVRLEDGTQIDVSQLSMQSASGFNYINTGLSLPPVGGGGGGSTPVPEPRSVWLVIAGLGALFAARRRRVRPVQ